MRDFYLLDDVEVNVVPATEEVQKILLQAPSWYFKLGKELNDEEEYALNRLRSSVLYTIY